MINAVSKSGDRNCRISFLSPMSLKAVSTLGLSKKDSRACASEILDREKQAKTTVGASIDVRQSRKSGNFKPIADKILAGFEEEIEGNPR
jgi:hypothetical protein